MVDNLLVRLPGSYPTLPTVQRQHLSLTRTLIRLVPVPFQAPQVLPLPFLPIPRPVPSLPAAF
jgi:hypothetical protein